MAFIGAGVLAPGGAKAHAAELAIAGILLALLGVAWAAGRDGAAALGGGGGEGHPGLPPAHAFRVGVLFLGGFLIVGLATRMSSVDSFDAACVLRFYKCGGPLMNRCMRAISNAGGGDLVRYGVPLALAACYCFGRARSLRFFVAAMFGTVGLEALLKALVHRARPDLGHGVYFDSYPSGHTLAATIMAGVLLAIWLPGCRRCRQRGLLWIVAIAWPVLMATARVYLGCHYVTDVLGGLLLGVAWVCFCRALLLTLARAEFAGSEAARRPIGTS
jgi:membrane-associated phospholipid phosphatase